MDFLSSRDSASEAASLSDVSSRIEAALSFSSTEAFLDDENCGSRLRRLDCFEVWPLSGVERPLRAPLPPSPICCNLLIWSVGTSNIDSGRADRLEVWDGRAGSLLGDAMPDRRSSRTSCLLLCFFLRASGNSTVLVVELVRCRHSYPSFYILGETRGDWKLGCVRIGFVDETLPFRAIHVSCLFPSVSTEEVT
jgi:hypothetical protein